MIHLEDISAVVGILLPLLIAVIQQAHWQPWFRAVIGFVSCFVAAFITTWIEGKLNTQDILTSFFIVFTVAEVSYGQFWKKVGVTNSIEIKTSPQRRV